LMENLAPEEKAKQLSVDAARLLQRVSQVGLGVYKDKGKDGVRTEDFGAAAVVTVDDAPKFMAEGVDLLKRVEQAANAKTKEKDKQVELQYQERKVAGKLSWLITAPGAKGEKASVLLLSALNARTVLVCSLTNADEA